MALWQKSGALEVCLCRYLVLRKFVHMLTSYRIQRRPRYLARLDGDETQALKKQEKHRKIRDDDSKQNILFWFILTLYWLHAAF